MAHNDLLSVIYCFKFLIGIHHVDWKTDGVLPNLLNYLPRKLLNHLNVVKQI
jgi:hypothetical protein